MKTKVISGVLNFSIVQVMAWLDKEFRSVAGKPLPVKMVGNKHGLRQAEAAFTKQNDGKSLTYPFALAVIAEISTDEVKAGFKKNHINNGFVVGKNVDNATAIIEDLRPVKVGIGVNFRTSDIQEVILLAHILLMNVPRVGFAMKGDSGFMIETSVTIDPAVTLPETNFESPGEGFQYEFVLVLNTYVGYASEMKLIRNIVFNTTDNGEDFWAGDPYFDLTKTINFTEYYDKNSTLYKGYEEEGNT